MLAYDSYFVFVVPATGETFHVTAKMEPDDSGLQIEAGQTIARTMEDLQSIPLIANNYRLSLTGNIIRFTTIEKGLFDFQGVSMAHVAAYTLRGVVDSGARLTVQSNYSILTSLLIGLQKTTFASYVNESGQAVVEIGQYLKSFFSFRLPYFKQDIINLWEILLKYQVSFNERYGETPEEKKIYFAEDKYALNGCYPFVSFPGTDIAAWFVNNKEYLTAMPVKQKTWSEAQHFLYFLNLKENTKDLVIKVKLFFTDNNSMQVDALMINARTTQYKGFCLPCGCNQLKLKTYRPDKTIYRYDISLWDWDYEGSPNNAQVGKTMTFILEEKPLFARQFLAMNSFGVPETFNTTGLLSSEKKVQRRTNKKYLAPDYIASEGQYESETQSTWFEFTCRTGFKAKPEIENIANLLASKYFYLVDETDQKYISCQLTDDAYKTLDDENDVASIEFKFRYSHDEL
jgi:hypothetical protein